MSKLVTIFSLFSLFVFDRLTKIYLLKKSLDIPSTTEGFQSDFFHLYLNQDLAFSLPILGILLWPLLAIIFLVLVTWFYQKYLQTGKISWPLALILLGAFSNILDRLLYQGVIDFINLPFSFPVFNFSDVYITIGVGVLILQEFRKK